MSSAVLPPHRCADLGAHGGTLSRCNGTHVCPGHELPGSRGRASGLDPREGFFRFICALRQSRAGRVAVVVARRRRRSEGREGAQLVGRRARASRRACLRSRGGPERRGRRRLSVLFSFPLAHQEVPLTMTDFPLTGGCNCGAVRFEVTAPLALASYCHCKRCQRRSGAAASANAHPAPDAFRIVAGEDTLRVWKPDGGGEKWFCGDCGSSLFGRNPGRR